MESDALMRRFFSGGFESLVEDEPYRLASYLEDEAVRTSDVSKLFLAETIRDVQQMLQQHEESGGVRWDFIRYLDQRLLQVLPSIQAAERIEAAIAAQELRAELRALMSAYDPRK